MKAITKYRADDGAEFDTESKCAAHEGLCGEIAALMGKLFPLPKDDGCDFANGAGFIQHDFVTFSEVRVGLLQLAQRECPHHWINDTLARPSEVHPSYAARIIGECSRPLSVAWSRIACTDRKFREWGQPYYAEHPDQAKQFQVNGAMGSTRGGE